MKRGTSGKGKHSEDDNQSGLPKFVRDKRAEAERKHAAKKKVADSKQKRGQ